MQKIILTMALAVLLVLAGCNDDEQDERSEADGPDARGPRGKDYISTVLRSRNRAQQVQSKALLKGAGMGLAMYLVENNEQWPESLQPLVEGGFLAENALLSPADKKTPIVYIQPEPDAEDNTVVAYDPALYPGDKMNVLHMNGSVGEMSKQDLDAQLKAQKNGVE
jgi:hypothetical protein